MPRFIVPPKYIYTQDSGTFSLPVPTLTNFARSGINGMFDWLSKGANAILIAPVPTLPDIGNDHTQRSHSKITVTTLRWKLTLNLDVHVLLQGTAFDDMTTSSGFLKFPTATDYTGATGTNVIRPLQYPPNPNQFYKFRYMMVEFDEDLAMTQKNVLSWFYSTYCFYRDPTGDPQATLPTVEASIENTVPGPISVHSNIMRITTPWIGKFKILADKCFEITANRPRVSIDLTIPINRVYSWDDEGVELGLSSFLIRPHIYCFVIPPLSYEQDVSIYDHAQCQWLAANLTPATTPTHQFVTWQSWMKLNFVDI